MCSYPRAWWRGLSAADERRPPVAPAASSDNALARALHEGMLAITGVLEGESAFAEGAGFWLNGKQVAHFPEPGVLALRLTRGVIRAERTRLKKDERVVLRSNSSDWLAVHFGSEADIGFVLGLAELSAAAHRSPDGSVGPPPPSGAELARRRHFH